MPLSVALALPLLLLLAIVVIARIRARGPSARQLRRRRAELRPMAQRLAQAGWVSGFVDDADALALTGLIEEQELQLDLPANSGQIRALFSLRGAVLPPGLELWLPADPAQLRTAAEHRRVLGGWVLSDGSMSQARGLQPALWRELQGWAQTCARTGGRFEPMWESAILLRGARLEIVGLSDDAAKLTQTLVEVSGLVSRIQTAALPAPCALASCEPLQR